MSEIKPRRFIKLFCPSTPKTASMAAWDEQRLDLGAIARTFELDRSTVKLNGHFIGRGAEHVAASVTWKSLLSFFSGKGLPTGENGNKPIIVDGKLCKLGAKRGREFEFNEVSGDDRGRPELKDADLVLKWKKMRTSNGLSGNCSKRKQLAEDVNQLKKLKISETTSDIQGKRCSYMSGEVKKTREDEVAMAAPCKKIR